MVQNWLFEFRANENDGHGIEVVHEVLIPRVWPGSVSGKIAGRESQSVVAVIDMPVEMNALQMLKVRVTFPRLIASNVQV